MIGVEIVAPGAASGTASGAEPARPRHDGALAAAIKREAFDHGLLLETGGRHGAVLRMLPPLIVTRSDVGAILDRLDAAVTAAKRQTRRR